jgi:hypothetical protein
MLMMNASRKHPADLLTNQSALNHSPSALRPPKKRRSSLWLSAAATGVTQHLRSAQVAQVACMLRDIEAAEDPVDAISELLQVRRLVGLVGGSRVCLAGVGQGLSLVCVAAAARLMADLVTTAVIIT